MAVLTKTVGGTTPDYTTITLAEASIPANMVTDGNQRRFQCRDVTFTEADIDWGAGVTTDSTNYPALEAESGSAFNGIAGNGPIIDKSTGTATASGYVIRLSADYSQLINIEVSNSQTRATSGDYIGISVNSDFNLVARNIVHDIDSAPTTRRAKGIDVVEALSLTFYILNNVVHNLGGTNEGRGIIMGLWDSGHTGHIIGNSVYNAAPSANGFGITASWDNGSASTLNCYNNISIGQNNDYDQQGTTALTLNASNNGDGDFTALGTSAQSGLSASTEWVSITAGSEDLHLNSGATSVGNGSDRGTTPTGVEIDIDGTDRNANAGTWDIGAHQFVFNQSVAPSPINEALAVVAPSVTTPAYNIAPTPIAESFTVVSPTAAPGGVAVAPTPTGEALAVVSPVVAPGARAINPTPIGETFAVVVPTVALGGVSVSPTPIAESLAVVSPVIAPGGVAVAPSPILESLGVVSPAVASGGAAGVAPTPIIESLAVVAPAVAPGGRSINPTPIGESLVVVAPTVTSGAQTAIPTPIGQALTVVAPTLAAGGVSVAPVPLVETLVVVSPTAASGNAIAPAPIGESLVVVAPSLATGSVTVSPTPIIMTLTIVAPGLAGGAVLGAYTGTIDARGAISGLVVAVQAQTGVVDAYGSISGRIQRRPNDN